MKKFLFLILILIPVFSYSQERTVTRISYTVDTVAPGYIDTVLLTDFRERVKVSMVADSTFLWSFISGAFTAGTYFEQLFSESNTTEWIDPKLYTKFFIKKKSASAGTLTYRLIKEGI